MKVLAIICMRNEVDVLAECIEYLRTHEVDVYIMDNGSTDGSLELAESYLDKGVVKIERFPSESGFPAIAADEYRWEWILDRKEQISQLMDYDWFIHADADEFRDGPWSNCNLRESIAQVDQEGYNCINFEVIDFQWTEKDKLEEASCQKRMLYYWHRPWWNSAQVRAWKKQSGPILLSKSGGHFVEFPGRLIYPRRFILRHYPKRSLKQCEAKLIQDRANRITEDELKKGWHYHILDYSKQPIAPVDWKLYRRAENPWVDFKAKLSGIYQYEKSLLESVELNPNTFEFSFVKWQRVLRSNQMDFDLDELKLVYRKFAQWIMLDQPESVVIEIKPILFSYLMEYFKVCASFTQDLSLAKKLDLLAQKVHP